MDKDSDRELIGRREQGREVQKNEGGDLEGKRRKGEMR